MYTTINEAYCLFKEENPDTGIGRSKFAELRPANVLVQGDTPRNVCASHFNFAR